MFSLFPAPNFERESCKQCQKCIGDVTAHVTSRKTEDMLSPPCFPPSETGMSPTSPVTFSHDLMNRHEEVLSLQGRESSAREEKQRAASLCMFSQHLTAAQETRIAWGYLRKSSGNTLLSMEKEGGTQMNGRDMYLLTLALGFFLKGKIFSKQRIC